MFFSAVFLVKSVTSCICFSSRCFCFLFVEFDSASNWACIYIACASSLSWIGGFVCRQRDGSVWSMCGWMGVGSIRCLSTCLRVVLVVS